MENIYRASLDTFKIYSNMESTRTCRLCAKQGDTCSDILNRHHLEIVRIIEKFFGIHISIKDEFHYVCRRCDKKMNEFYEYYKEVLDAQKYFKSYHTKNEEDETCVEFLTVPIDVIKEEAYDDDDSECIVKQEPMESDEPGDEIFDETANEDFPFIKSDEQNSEEDEKPLREIKKTSTTKDKEISIAADEEINKFYDFTCPECFFKADCWQEYKNHMTQEHDHKFPIIMCCNTKIQIRANILLGHMEYHSNPDKFKCRFCAKQCKNARSKRNHEYRHKLDRGEVKATAANQKKPCPECGKMLSSKYSYEKHMQLHMSTEEREKLKVQCHLCTKFFVSKPAIFIHMKIKHMQKEESISCDQCARTFGNRMAFTSHYRTHHSTDNKVICPDCGIELKVDSLRRHRKMKHDHQAQVCTVCNKEFKNKLSLRIHQLRVHIEPKYACDICGRMFKVKDKLKEHRTNHFTANRFSCDQCEYVNNDYANMLKHRKTKHQDAPPLAHGSSRKVFEAGHNSSINPGF